MTDESQKQLYHAIQRGHEPNYVDPRRMKLSIVGLVLLMVGALLIVSGTRAFLTHRVATETPPRSVIERTLTLTGPLATEDQPQQLHELRQSEQRRLESYEWIDESAGIARIPIDRAIEILAERGLTATESESEVQQNDTRD